MIIRIDMIGTMDVYASHRIEVPADEISAEAILGAAEMAIQNHEVAWKHEGVEVNRISYSDEDIRVWDTEFGDWVSLEDWLANHGGEDE